MIAGIAAAAVASFGISTLRAASNASDTASDPAYAGGFTTDVNNDGMFLFTLGAAHYQTGNSRSEPFVDAPFMRMKYHTSNAAIFGYSEIETTVHIRSYLSGTVGVGFRLTEKINIIAGVAHTEFIMPTEEMVREVDGFHGILNWSF